MSHLPNSIEARDIAYHFHPNTNARLHEEVGPMVIEKGDGIYVEDNTGKRYIEALGGLWSVALGFGEKRLAQAAYDQMLKLPYYHTFGHKAHGPVVELAEKLIGMAPVPMSKVHFTNSGSEANDLAIKMIWYRSNALGQPQRKKIIARLKGYHGVTIAAGSLTGLPNNHRSFDLPIANILHTSSPHYRTAKQEGESEEAFSARCAAELEALILAEGPETIAAFFAEPVMGAGGVIVPPKGYWEAMQPVLKKYDILFVADEVICGFGRTGEKFATTTYKLQPDIMTLSKQITSSYFPLSALLINDKVYQPIADESKKIGIFGHGFTASGHPVAAAVALENLKIFEERDLFNYVKEIAPHSDGHDHDHGEHDGCDHSSNPWETRSLGVSGVLVGLGLVAQWMILAPALATELVFTVAMLAGGWFLLPKAWRALRRLRPDINLLVVIAAIGASVIGEWAEAATVVFLFGVAEWLESWADRRARRAVKALLEIAPKTATVKREDRFVEVSVEEVAVGEVIAVKSAMNIPLDGEVLAGESSVNQAPITGESVPVDKKPSDTVFAGTINGEGSLEVRVTKAAGDTTLARIIRLVQQAQEEKAPTQRFVDVFARYYTPSVTVVALLIFLVPPLFFGGDWPEWLYRACVLLIIACPCALVISTPVSIVAGLTALARLGVLVKGGAHLEAIAKLQALAVDKTGTITEGKPQVQGVESLNDKSNAEILRIAAAVDAHSPHPLAKAVVEHASKHGIAFPRAENYQARSGRGAEGIVEGHAYFVGNHRFTHELGVCSPEIENRLAAIESRGQSVVVVGHRPHGDCTGEVLGILAIGDTVRPNATAAIRSLHTAGVVSVTMLSGDNQRTADAIAKQVGIDEARGDLLPEDKVEAVKALREMHGSVGMVGDGVNDAPAMATATVGIAMGGAGTDAAIETADVTLMTDDLAKIADTVRLSRRTMGIIRFNITFALGLKALFLALTLMGHASLWLAIMADTGATLLVVANALRLLRAGPPI